jgi:hypothetical protein
VAEAEAEVVCAGGCGCEEGEEGVEEGLERGRWEVGEVFGEEVEGERKEGGWKVAGGVKEVREAGIGHGLRIHLGSHLIVDVRKPWERFLETR